MAAEAWDLYVSKICEGIDRGAEVRKRRYSSRTKDAYSECREGSGQNGRHQLENLEGIGLEDSNELLAMSARISAPPGNRNRRLFSGSCFARRTRFNFPSSTISQSTAFRIICYRVER